MKVCQGLKALLLVSASSSLLWAADVALFPVTTTNLTPNEGDAIGVVMAQQYAKISKKPVIGPIQSGKVLQEQNGDLSAAAKVMGVAEYITMSATALQVKILLETILYNQNGNELYRIQMTAMSLDDMTEATDRMARSLVFRLPSEETRDLDNITLIETQEKNRLFAEKVTGIKTWLLASIRDGKTDPMVTIGYNMKLESEKFFLEFGASALLPADFAQRYDDDIYGGVALEMGADYYLLNHPMTSPYIGGGVSPRFLFAPGAVSVVPYAQFGVMLMRMSHTRLYADLRIAQNVMPLTYTDYNYDNTSYNSSPTKKSYYPTEIGLEIGIGW
jgi:hypothetical protein